MVRNFLRLLGIYEPSAACSPSGARLTRCRLSSTHVGGSNIFRKKAASGLRSRNARQSLSLTRGCRDPTPNTLRGRKSSNSGGADRIERRREKTCAPSPHDEFLKADSHGGLAKKETTKQEAEIRLAALRRLRATRLKLRLP